MFDMPAKQNLQEKKKKKKKIAIISQKRFCLGLVVFEFVLDEIGTCVL